MRAFPIAIAGVLPILFTFTGAAAVEEQGQKDRLRIEWKTPCTSVASANPAVVCVPASDPLLSKLGEYSTVQVSTGGAAERRFQLLPATTAAAWRVLVDSPGTTVCEIQPAKGPPVCGPVATKFAAADCQKAAGADATTRAATSCTLRPTPFDNPSFPHFPNPEVETPGYFAPWPAGGTPGSLPGDLDKLFFENLNALGPAPADAAPDLLSPPQRRQLEIMAWQEFLGVNWPVDDDDGQTRLDPVTMGGMGVCPAWAGWRRRDEVMRGAAALPIPWGINPSVDGTSRICNAFLDGGKVAMLSATGGSLGSGLGNLGAAAKQPDGHLLYDRNGLLVFYDVRINRFLHDYILRESLYRGEPPKERISFPLGQLWPTFGLGLLKAPGNYEGPIAVKFAWKQLTNCDRQDDFLLARADIAEVERRHELDDMRDSSCADATATKATATGTKSAAPEPGREDCRPQCDGEVCLLGLVAMHIAHKTGTNPSWNWSTFVHRGALDGPSPLFDTTGCDGRSPAGMQNCNECGGKGCVTRICRPFRPAADTRALNDEVRAMLEGAQTPLFRTLANYELLGVQWVGKTGAGLHAVPNDLLNPLMETFVTDSSPHDCYSCHLHAKPGDFLFFLDRLVPKPAGQTAPAR